MGMSQTSTRANEGGLDPWNLLLWDLCLEGPLVAAVVQLLRHVQLFVTPWTAAHQGPLFSAISWTLPKFMSIELVMLSNHLILFND